MDLASARHHVSLHHMTLPEISTSDHLLCEVRLGKGGLSKPRRKVRVAGASELGCGGSLLDFDEIQRLKQQYELTSTPELLSLGAYVSKDGLVSHHWKQRPFGLAKLYTPVQGNAMAKKGEWVGRGLGGVNMGDLWDSIENVNEENA